VKAQVPHRFTDSFQSGYVPPATPRSKTAKVDIIENAKPNLLAKYLVTRELPPSDSRYKPINVWPEDLPGFRETVMVSFRIIKKRGVAHRSVERLPQTARCRHSLTASCIRRPATSRLRCDSRSRAAPDEGSQACRPCRAANTNIPASC
jgi:hypothetical protein